MCGNAHLCKYNFCGVLCCSVLKNCIVHTEYTLLYLLWLASMQVYMTYNVDTCLEESVKYKGFQVGRGNDC